ncbi:MAG: hypothetical protein EOP45_01085 [Sphingobacteriaceae bacterium]|nr:MAG: hypothetical protein EOP45_01085 [Sphingobacteriaceae bacterium]
MIRHFESRKAGYHLHLTWFEKYEIKQVGTICRIVEILYGKHQKDKNYSYKLDYRFFSNYPFITEKKLEFAKKLYLDQEDIDSSFDPSANGLFYIMKYDTSFFTEYISLRVERYKQHFTIPRNSLTKIWEFEDAPELTYDALVKISDVIRSSISVEDFGASLFIQLKPDAQLVAIPVLKRLLLEFPKDHRKIDLVMRIGRQFLSKDYYEVLIQEWLTINRSLEDFRQTDWTNHHWDYANGMPGDQRIRTYELVLDAIELMPENYRFAKHKLFLHEQINRQRQIVAEEVKMMYRGLL